jgi:hypothetical protein
MFTTAMAVRKKYPEGKQLKGAAYHGDDPEQKQVQNWNMNRNQDAKNNCHSNH